MLAESLTGLNADANHPSFCLGMAVHAELVNIGSVWDLHNPATIVKVISYYDPQCLHRLERGWERRPMQLCSEVSEAFCLNHPPYELE